MILAVCPIHDSNDHKLFDSLCNCGCKIELVNGNMIIEHSAFSEIDVDMWGVFEQGKGLTNEN